MKIKEIYQNLGYDETFVFKENEELKQQLKKLKDYCEKMIKKQDGLTAEIFAYEDVLAKMWVLIQTPVNEHHSICKTYEK